MAVAKRCPRCKAACEAGARICVGCGLNLQTGEELRVTVDEPETEPESVERGPNPALQFVALWFPGLFRPWLLVCMAVVCVLALGAAAMAAFFFALGAIFVTIMAGAVAFILYGQALGWLLTGEMQILTECLVEFNAGRWLVFFALLVGPMVGGLYALTIILGG